MYLNTEHLSMPIKVRCYCKIVADGTNNTNLQQMECKSLKLNSNIVSSIEVSFFTNNIVVRSLLKKSCIWQSISYHMVTFIMKELIKIIVANKRTNELQITGLMRTLYVTKLQLIWLEPMCITVSLWHKAVA